MLSFEEKLQIIESFSELQRNDVSLKRVNFQYIESGSDKKNVVYHLHMAMFMQNYLAVTK